MNEGQVPGPMPPDPFSDGMLDWGPLAANNYAFFAAHLGAGFSEQQSLDLTGRYLSFIVSVMFATQPAQQQPEA
jgi:hypothetical protein